MALPRKWLLSLRNSKTIGNALNDSEKDRQPASQNGRSCKPVGGRFIAAKGVAARGLAALVLEGVEASSGAKLVPQEDGLGWRKSLAR